MSYFKVNYLGVGCATPTVRHNPAAQLVDYHKHHMLIDCGEATQLQMQRYHHSFAGIDHIFISHLHGDHFLGLPGLLSTLSLHDIGGTVTVHTFAEGVELIRRVVDYVCRDRSYTLEFNVITPGTEQLLYDDNNLTVRSFPLYHRVPCVGFRFDEKPKLRHINGEMAEYYKVPHYLMNELRAGADLVLPDGTVIDNERLTTDPSPSLSYAYCSDTVYDERVARAVEGIDTLYHEATYGDDGAAKAMPRGHSTARQAARIAALAGARRLVLGHFSSSIQDEAALAQQAAEEFGGEVIIGAEGLTIDLI